MKMLWYDKSLENTDPYILAEFAIKVLTNNIRKIGLKKEEMDILGNLFRDRMTEEIDYDQTS